MRCKARASIVLEELNLQLQQTQGSVEGVRIDLQHLNEELQLNANRLKDAEETFKAEENNYNEANNQYNEFNLQVTKQQSKISALKQELEFKNNQLKDLQVQIETNIASAF